MTATVAATDHRPLWLALAALQVFDLASTWWWLRLGGGEANPAMAVVLALGAWGFLAALFAKLLLVSRCSRSEFPAAAVWVALALYSAGAVWNLHLIVRTVA